MILKYFCWYVLCFQEVTCAKKISLLLHSFFGETNIKLSLVTGSRHKTFQQKPLCNSKVSHNIMLSFESELQTYKNEKGSNCRILTVSPLIYAIGGKKPEKKLKTKLVVLQ